MRTIFAILLSVLLAFPALAVYQLPATKLAGDLDTNGHNVSVGDLIDTSYGLKNSTASNIQVNLSASSGLEFGTGALKIDPADASLTLAAGGVSVKSAILKRVLANGTDSAVNVTVSGMATGDELVSVIAYTNKTAIASMADRTSEYAVGSGQLTKAAGTNETDNQLDIVYLDRT